MLKLKFFGDSVYHQLNEHGLILLTEYLLPHTDLNEDEKSEFFEECKVTLNVRDNILLLSVIYKDEDFEIKIDPYVSSTEEISKFFNMFIDRIKPDLQ